MNGGDASIMIGARYSLLPQEECAPCLPSLAPPQVPLERSRNDHTKESRLPRPPPHHPRSPVDTKHAQQGIGRVIARNVSAMQVQC